MCCLTLDVPDDNTVNANHNQAPQYQPPQSQPQPQQQQSQPKIGAATPSFSNSTIAPSAIGKISDYDPLNDQPRNSPYSARQNQTVIYTSDRGAGICLFL